ncbi:hypothetical protein [Chondromyces apiculatus]|uniref:Uncharacterized protein n=1 Tax=Chondromyces apiculatus DSM 436 TaxID=1192034 RepID=A0A017SXF8_9BACT|nr:hypothetical protein [Chondromyces apiculatus]EYF01628.1 Hypothetical protein CAP_7947 [Chondromyces apiculatus DSM 436]
MDRSSDKQAGHRRGPGGGILGPTVLALVVALPATAAADSLPTNDYSLDLFQGPILAPLRVTGIAGAYAGYAEGIPGMVVNAAAPALREPFSIGWVDYDISASISIPLEMFENNDFDNSGTRDADYSNFIYGTLGAMFQVGPFGAGANADLSRYDIEIGGQRSAITLGRYHILAGMHFFDGQFVVGGGARAVTMGVDAPNATLTLLGIGPQFGLMVRPDWSSWRFGATFRFPVDGGAFILGDDEAVDDDGIRSVGGLVLPDRVVLPWELELGMAIQVGPRPFNPEWRNPRDEERDLREEREEARKAREERWAEDLREAESPEVRRELEQRHAALRTREAAREQSDLERAYHALKEDRRARAKNWPREHLLLTASLLVTGPVERGVSMEWFLRGNVPDEPSKVGSSGAAVNFSPRFGIETEPVFNLIATRLGSYYEPSRFGQVGRQHFTFGADLKMFSTTFGGLVPEVTYSLRTAMDFAPRYESVSLGLGVWR